MSYTPTPLETSAIVLPEELSALGERLAENAHDVWAAQRLADGWSLVRNEKTKRNNIPAWCLTPSCRKSEKEYDRLSVVGTLKAIIKLGYRMVPPQQ